MLKNIKESDDVLGVGFSVFQKVFLKTGAFLALGNFDGGLRNVDARGFYLLLLAKFDKKTSATTDVKGCSGLVLS
jgi:hypothetical protein